MTVARMFFSNNPAWNRELYEAVQQQMQRDYSPTYWFRVMRAQQLLALYRRDPEEFAHLARSTRASLRRAARPHRLSRMAEEGRSGVPQRRRHPRRLGTKLVKALNRPDYFGYSVKRSPTADDLTEASPAALGTLAYIAFETRRLFEAMNPKGPFRPLEVTSLVETEDLPGGRASRRRSRTAPGRCSIWTTPRCLRRNWSACASCSTTWDGKATWGSWKTGWTACTSAARRARGFLHQRVPGSNRSRVRVSRKERQDRKGNSKSTATISGYHVRF